MVVKISKLYSTIKSKEAHSILNRLIFVVTNAYALFSHVAMNIYLSLQNCMVEVIKCNMETITKDHTKEKDKLIALNSLPKIIWVEVQIVKDVAIVVEHLFATIFQWSWSMVLVAILLKMEYFINIDGAPFSKCTLLLKPYFDIDSFKCDVILKY